MCSARLKTKVIKVHYQSYSMLYVVSLVFAKCQQQHRRQHQRRRHCLSGNYSSISLDKYFSSFVFEVGNESEYEIEIRQIN